MENQQNRESTSQNPADKYPVPPFLKQKQVPPGTEGELTPKADHGEDSYKGSGKLNGKKAVITGGDSVIRKTVAIALAREECDVLISYLSEKEDEDAYDTASWIEQAGQKAILLRGDISKEAHCKEIIQKTVSEFGKINVCERLLANTRVVALCCHQGGYSEFSANLAQILLEEGKGIRVNAVAPGPVWTPLIPSTMPELDKFCKNTPIGRPGQPAELAPAYVFLASQESSCVSGATLPFTGAGSQSDKSKNVLNLCNYVKSTI